MKFEKWATGPTSAPDGTIGYAVKRFVPSPQARNHKKRSTF